MKDDFQIFLSHHETEIELAQNLRTFLSRISSGIEVNTYIQKKEPESDFRNWINESAMSSDMYIFFYTDDIRELSWVAHELGMYIASRKRDEKKLYIICLRSEGISKMPEVMSHIAPISATHKNIQFFLENLLIKGQYTKQTRLVNDSIDAKVALKDIDNAAKELSSLFKTKIYTQYFTDRISIKNIMSSPLLKFKGNLQKESQLIRKLRNSVTGEEEEHCIDFTQSIIEMNENLRTILGLPKPCTWFDLISVADNGNPANRFNIAQGIIEHASCDDFSNTSSMILAEMELNGRIFRPIISRIDKRNRLPVSYNILLIPDEKSRDEEIGKHNDLSIAFERDIKLVLLLSSARRFRWNLVEPFIWKIRRAITSSDDLTIILDDLMKSLEKIELESEKNKLDNGTLAALLFPDDCRVELEKIWLDYFKTRKKLAVCVKNKDIKQTLQIMNEFQKMNRAFMETGLETYKKLMKDLPVLEDAGENWIEKLIR